MPSINITNDLVTELGNALNFWLSYQASLHRASILEEKILNLPISEFLLANKNSDVFTEKPHPIFSNRRIDVKAYFNENQHINGKQYNTIYIENKWVRGNTASFSEKQRIFNDLFRLASIKQTQPSAACLLVVAGSNSDFNLNFLYHYKRASQPVDRPQILKRNISNTKNTFYEMWFGKGINQTTLINLKNQPNTPDYTLIYENCIKEYSSIKSTLTTVPESITTKRLFLTELDYNSNGNGIAKYSVGIWSIEL